MASAAALAYLPASAVGDEESWWPWALMGLTPVGARELVLPFLIVCWLMTELCFFLVMRLVHSRLDVLTPPERSVHEPEAYVAKVMDIVDSVRGVYPFETFLTRWCGAATMDELKRGNVAQFLAWALLSEKVENLLPKDFMMIMRMLDMVDKRFELKLEHGINTDVRTLRMTLEPLEVIHRPLCMYMMVTYVPRIMGNCVLRLQGFERMEYHGTVYWYRASRDWPQPARQLPLVFFHGVSPGQCAYAGLTTLLSEGRSAVLVEIPHIAMSLEAFRAKREDEVTEAVRGICQRHHIQHFVVGGHSYGTIWAGWVLRALRQQVKQAVLLDPVCILLCLPNTPFNFLYRHPHDPPSHLPKAPSIFTTAGIKKRVFDYGLHYVVSRELTIANAMRRQFWWHKKILHAEDIHCPTIVGLASDDILLSAPAIRKYLEDNCTDLEIIWWQDFSHGELLTSLPSQHHLDQAIREQEEQYYHGNRQRPIWEYPPGQPPTTPLAHSSTFKPRRSRSRSRLVQESSVASSERSTDSPLRSMPSSPASFSSASSSDKGRPVQRRKKRHLGEEPMASPVMTPTASPQSSRRAAGGPLPPMVSGAGCNENAPSDEQRRRWHQQQDRERDEAAAEVEKEAARRLHANPPLAPFIPDSEPDSSIKMSQEGNSGLSELTAAALKKEDAVAPEAPPAAAPQSLLGSLVSTFW